MKVLIVLYPYFELRSGSLTEYRIELASIGILKAEIVDLNKVIQRYEEKVAQFEEKHRILVVEQSSKQSKIEYELNSTRNSKETIETERNRNFSQLTRALRLVGVPEEKLGDQREIIGAVLDQLQELISVRQTVASLEEQRQVKIEFPFLFDPLEIT